MPQAKRSRPVEELENARITVMGLGLHGGGAAAARFCAERGAQVTVTDLQSEEALGPSLETLAGLPIRYVLGRHEEPDFRNADMVIKNPAVPRNASYLKLAPRIETDLSLFLSALWDPGTHGLTVPLIAVTGTKGKSTTASAIHHGFRRLGYRSYLGGNITISPLSFLGEILQLKEPRQMVRRAPRDGHSDTVSLGSAGSGSAGSGSAGSSSAASESAARSRPSHTGSSVIVLEISSFQLGDLLLTAHPEQLTPRVAVITNIFEDHQDYYGSMPAYVADKRLIYRYQAAHDTLIYHADDAYGPSFAAESAARALAVSRTKLPPDLPGAYLSNGAVLAHATETVPLLPPETAARGAHMQMNLLTAALALYAFGVAPEDAAESVADFGGIPHRLEELGSAGGVRFINDSAATIPDAALQAAETFSEPIFLIAGGSDKNGSFDAFPSIIERVAHTYLLPGGGTERILSALQDTQSGTPSDHDEPEKRGGTAGVEGPFTTLRGAFDHAYAAAAHEAGRSGGAVVLLSPGCASFGMFKNEFDRGRQFTDLVLKVLKRDRRE